MTGLGHSGSAIAMTLNFLERKILGVESDSTLVERFSPIFPVMEIDTSRLGAMKQFGVWDFSAVMVGAGILEAFVLIAANLVDIGTGQTWVRAVSREQGKILRHIGAHHVVYPEFDVGKRTAHLADGCMLDYIEMDHEGLFIVKMRPPAEVQGFTPAESDMRRHYGVNILGVVSPGQRFECAKPGTMVAANGLIIVSGDGKLLDDFASRP